MPGTVCGRHADYQVKVDAYLAQHPQLTSCFVKKGTRLHYEGIDSASRNMRLLYAHCNYYINDGAGNAPRGDSIQAHSRPALRRQRSSPLTGMGTMGTIGKFVGIRLREYVIHVAPVTLILNQPLFLHATQCLSCSLQRGNASDSQDVLRSDSPIFLYILIDLFAGSTGRLAHGVMLRVVLFAQQSI